MGRSLKTMLAVLAVGLFVLGPTSASAFIVYQGSDRTYTINDRAGFAACDREADGRPMRGKARDFRGAIERETDGGDRGCDRRRNPPDLRRITALETCEIINNFPDSCSGFKTS